jgi:hypothetical protein
VFFSDKDDNNTHFDLSNVVLNGIAFWDLSEYADPSEINFNNVQGCTQAVGNKLNTGQNVRLTRCGFAPVPEPNTGLLLVAGLLGLAIRRRTPSSVTGSEPPGNGAGTRTDISDPGHRDV